MSASRLVCTRMLKLCFDCVSKTSSTNVIKLRCAGGSGPVRMLTLDEDRGRGSMASRGHV